MYCSRTNKCLGKALESIAHNSSARTRLSIHNRHTMMHLYRLKRQRYHYEMAADPQAYIETRKWMVASARANDCTRDIAEYRHSENICGYVRLALIHDRRTKVLSEIKLVCNRNVYDDLRISRRIDWYMS